MLLNPLRLSAHCRRAAPPACTTVACAASLLMAISNGISAPAANLPSERPPAPLSMEDGFTRESLMEFDAPEPAPFVPAPAASIEASDDQPHADAGVRHRHRARHHPPEQPPAQIAVVKAAPRRSPVQSFVYWWNGFVIKTFHTKVGTVMLGTVGAKT